MLRLLAAVIGLAALLLSVSARAADEGAWKTAYVKRGFVGQFEAKWAAGEGATLRMLTPLQYGGSKVRVYVRGAYEDPVVLSKMALVAGADNKGKITGDPIPILFAGAPGLTLEKGLKTAVSDDITPAAPLSAGVWYVEDQYASPKFPYAYTVDHGTCEAGDAFTKETLSKPVTCRTGITWRVEVFTTDPRSSVLCWGDSLTAGYNSTPNAGFSYPAILGKLLKRPVLNLGQNGDMAQYAGGLPSATADLRGVDTVLFLMGINDIIAGGKVTTAKAYGDILQALIGAVHAQHRKFYLGTIPPAGGSKAYDADPAKETLRQEINTWIRQGNGADGVLDFDAALADPAAPTKMRADCQSDWLHPNDLGYQKMAEVAAQALAPKPAAP